MKLDLRSEKHLLPLCEITNVKKYRFKKNGHYFTGCETSYRIKPEFKDWVEKVGTRRALVMLNLN